VTRSTFPRCPKGCASEQHGLASCHFSEESLRSANKVWNPTGQKMVETIQKIQDAGIVVLSFIIHLRP
jgi:hypothetical protein